MNSSATVLALMPSFLDPVNLLNSFGGWVLAGLLLVVFIESGVLFPILPGDSLLFTCGLIASAGAAGVDGYTGSFAPLWVILVTVPIAATLGGIVGYYIGAKGGVRLFKPESKVFKQKYLDESTEFFEKHGPITIVLARFVPIVRTLVPIVAGVSRMNYAKFLTYTVVGAILWGSGVTLLGVWLGKVAFIREHIDIIFIVIVLVSVVPLFAGAFKKLLGRGAKVSE